MTKTAIEWTDEVWNPVTGCTKVSEGCRNCYADRVFQRFARDFSQVTIHQDRIEAPLRWKKPRRIFVNSMSDLFHEDVPDQFLEEVWAVMLAARQHTFQVLTKRPERMYRFLKEATHSEQSIHASRVLKVGHACDQDGPRNSMAKLTIEQVGMIRARRSCGEKLVIIAKDFDVTFQAISKIARGERWPSFHG